MDPLTQTTLPAPGPPRLARAIRLPHATALVVGTIIGASIFVQPSEVTGRVPSPEGAFLVWAVAGLLTLLGCLVTAELSARYPESGGVYVFLREAYSPLLGFLWGWAMFWTMHSGIIAAIAVVFGRYLAYFAPIGDAGIRTVGVLAILMLSAVNYVGVRQGSRLQSAFTLLKVAAILLVTAVGLLLGPRITAGAGNPGDGSGDGSGAAAGLQGLPGGTLSGPLGGATPAEFLVAVVAGLFAFGGWHMVTYSAEETVRPERTIPRSLLLGTGIVTACYLALNAVYFHVLPVETVISSQRVAADAADAVLGRGGGATLSLLVVLSTFGALAGIVLAGPRVYYAMARDGLLPRPIGTVHPRRRTPHRAILLQAGWASVLVWTGTYRQLFTRVIYTEWIFFGLMAIGLLLLRRRAAEHPRSERRAAEPESPDRREARAPPRDRGKGELRSRPWPPLMGRAYPWVPLVFALSAFGIVGNQILADPRESAVGLGFVLLGIPVYFLLRGRSGVPGRGRPPARRRRGPPAPPRGRPPARDE
ncbi:MAG: APC family permease [Gemmatimonadota bacterium]